MKRIASLFVRRIGHGFIIPAGYGVAWVRWQSGEAVCMPVPLNVLAGALRTAWLWLKAPRGIVDNPSAAYAAGHADGYRQAIKDATDSLN